MAPQSLGAPLLLPSLSEKDPGQETSVNPAPHCRMRSPRGLQPGRVGRQSSSTVQGGSLEA